MYSAHGIQRVLDKIEHNLVQHQTSDGSHSQRKLQMLF